MLVAFVQTKGLTTTFEQETFTNLYALIFYQLPYSRDFDVNNEIGGKVQQNAKISLR